MTDHDPQPRRVFGPGFNTIWFSQIMDAARDATAAFYPEARIPETPMPMTDREKELFDALSEVMEWISNWSPNFEQDDEWAATRAKVDAALAKAGGEA